MGLIRMSEHSQWGLLGPAVIPSSRRTRTLGVSNVIRAYNELAVPGIGNIWFAKQLLLSLLGIQLAENLRAEGRRASNIAAANAVEALSCLLIFRQTGFAANAKMRGNTKLQHGDMSFSKLSSTSGYVTQPMRMSSVQPLLALGLVESDGSQRFNSYRCSEMGTLLIEKSHSNSPGRSPQTRLLQWAHGSAPHNILSTYLDPRQSINPMSAAMIRESLAKSADKERRLALMSWLKNAPLTITERDIDHSSLSPVHIEQIKDGARFTAMRDAAHLFLDKCEEYLRRTTDKNIEVHDKSLHDHLKDEHTHLNKAALDYSDGWSRLKDGVDSAKYFSELCKASNSVRALRELVRRDGTILRIENDTILPGSAFEYELTSAEEAIDPDDPDTVAEDHHISWPKNLSPRLENFHYLILDLEEAVETT